MGLRGRLLVFLLVVWSWQVEASGDEKLCLEGLPLAVLGKVFTYCNARDYCNVRVFSNFRVCLRYMCAVESGKLDKNRVLELVENFQSSLSSKGIGEYYTGLRNLLENEPPSRLVFAFYFKHIKKICCVKTSQGRTKPEEFRSFKDHLRYLAFACWLDKSGQLEGNQGSALTD